MILYLDASAWVKRYIAEAGGDTLRRAARAADRWMMSRVGYVETCGALARRDYADLVPEFRAEWPRFEVLELSEPDAEAAAELAVSDGLGTLDAIHLASALTVTGDDLLFATWDRRLHAAAKARGLATLPEALG